MKAHYTVALSMAAGFGLGAVAVQGLHAQGHLLASAILLKGRGDIERIALHRNNHGEGPLAHEPANAGEGNQRGPTHQEYCIKLVCHHQLPRAVQALLAFCGSNWLGLGFAGFQLCDRLRQRLAGSFALNGKGGGRIAGIKTLRNAWLSTQSLILAARPPAW